MSVSIFGEEAPDEFGRFERALFTLFRIVAGDPLFPVAVLGEDGALRYGATLFYVGFLVVCNWVAWQARAPGRIRGRAGR